MINTFYAAEGRDGSCDPSLCSVCGHACGHSHGAEEIASAPVTVEQMAERREARAEKQAKLIAEHGLPLVCFTMNIAGPVKYSRAIELCFNAGCAELERELARIGARPEHSEYLIDATGCEGYFVYGHIAPPLLKAIAQKIEEKFGFGRLFDIDVIGRDGKKLERKQPRRCLICDNEARACARSRAHSLEELKEKTDALLREAIAYAAGTAAYEALIDEVNTTPKPGLVDLNNSGANGDMSAETFYAGAEALAPYFYSMAYTAADTETPASGHGEGCEEDEHINCADCASHESCALAHGASLMTKLTLLGVEAEAAMKQATGGVNTHKGAIYCLGLIVSAFARLAAENKSLAPLDIIEAAKDMALSRPLPPGGTNGDEVRRALAGSDTARLGADAEARAGFPSAVNAYRRILGFRLMRQSDNDCYALALLGIMAELNDTNAVKRGGEEGANFVRERAKEILALPLSGRLNEAAVFDRELIERNINCGGAADMLAAAILIDKLVKISERKK